ncbi:MAG: tetratricopeptide repeat protein, partial [Candidatus Delongbacteria bacterium]|nr:tetratricopeptide repeat protein [Candidatus Delongbacteria bacterium]
MKKNLRTYFLLIGILIFSGCAYYNMYFNAKESYNAAEKKRIEKNITDKALYENSIKELSKILEFYPESKWVDDALLMMGLCYMRQDDNYKARKKFIELLTNYPGSDLSDQAKVHLAEVEIALKNYDEAGKLMESISADDIDIEPYKILKLTAEMSLSQGDSVKALENLLRSADKAETDI